MKILILSTNKISGAGIAACKIYKTLKNKNINCDLKFLINSDNKKNLKFRIKRNILNLKLKIN